MHARRPRSLARRLWTLTPSPAQAAALTAAEAAQHPRPLLRLRVLRLAADDHRILLAINHTICDGYSLLLLMAELQHVYTCQVDRREPALPPIASTFWDLLDLRERQRVQPGHAAARAHWQAVFADPPRNERLAAPRRPGRDLAVAVHAGHLDPTRTAALREAASRRGVTLYTLVFAALFDQVRQAIGNDDLILGMPTAGRTLPLPGVELLFGCLVNVLPIRVRLRPTDGFDELLSRVSEASIAALRHMDYPCDVDYVPTMSFTFPTHGDAARPADPATVRFTLESLTNELGNDDLDISHCDPPGPDTPPTWRTRSHRRRSHHRGDRPQPRGTTSGPRRWAARGARAGRGVQRKPQPRRATSLYRRWSCHDGLRPPAPVIICRSKPWDTPTSQRREKNGQCTVITAFL